MREIKFRLLLRNMVVGYEIHRKGGALYVSVMHSPDGEDWKSILHFEPISHDDKVQFTGLRDKNGKDIYEGDIVGKKDVWWEPVVFDQGCFCVDLEPIGYYFEDEGTCLEILGNIYENPEILK